jgi:hypothetical protein
MSKERDPRVVAVAENLALAYPYGFERVKNGPSGADYHAALIAVKTLDEMAEYEYAVQVHQDDPNRWVVIGRILAYGEGPYWGSKVTMEEHIERQREYWTDRTFRLVQRVKAGRIENV